jgi:hypothetical protein
VLTDVTTDMVITKEETFGPVAPLYRFKTDDEAVRMANDTEFGLAAYFYSRDIGRIWRVAEGLEYGIVGINEGIISVKSTGEIAPFGGMKENGIGPILKFTGAQNTTSRSSSRSNTPAWAASTARHARPRRRDPDGGGGRASKKPRVIGNRGASQAEIPLLAAEKRGESPIGPKKGRSCRHKGNRLNNFPINSATLVNRGILRPEQRNFTTDQRNIRGIDDKCDR